MGRWQTRSSGGTGTNPERFLNGQADGCPSSRHCQFTGGPAIQIGQTLARVTRTSIRADGDWRASDSGIDSGEG